MYLYYSEKYTSGAVRQIGVSYSGFVDESYTLLSLFDDVEQIEKDNRLQTAIDVVREQFGFLAIQKGTVLTEGSRNIERSKLIGGHSAGGLEGLK
ncbi:UmuC-MucB-like protein [Streptococcus pneumoniae]|jgi:orf5|nr:UmuC-MucB-like protein [Streptococcus pneumoniae]